LVETGSSLLPETVRLISQVGPGNVYLLRAGDRSKIGPTTMIILERLKKRNVGNRLYGHHFLPEYKMKPAVTTLPPAVFIGHLRDNFRETLELPTYRGKKGHIDVIYKRELKCWNRA